MIHQITEVDTIDNVGDDVTDPPRIEFDDEHKERIRKLRTPDKINNYIYLGDRLHGAAERVMKEHGITHVLNVHHSCRFPPPNAPWVFLHVPVSDYGDSDLGSVDSKTLRMCFAFMQKAKEENGVVLVHCRKGINRSPTIVIAWLMCNEGMTLKKAHTLVQQCRPCASPHEKYFKQLQTVDQRVHGAVSYTREEAGPSLQDMMRSLRTHYQEKEEEEEEDEGDGEQGEDAPGSSMQQR